MKNEYQKIVQRNYGVYSKSDQKKLRSAKITIVGIGCDGGMDAYILSRMGIGHLKLIDFDINEISNLNRQPAAFYDAIGEKKVKVAKKEFSRFNPYIKIEAVDAKLTEDNAADLLKGCDVCIQGMDSIVGRIIFHRAAKKLKIPAVTMTGQPPYRNFISTLLPNGPTYEDLFGINFVVGKNFKNHPALEEKIEKLKYKRGEHVVLKTGLKKWIEDYKRNIVGWSVTPERAYLTSVYQVNEAIRIIIGKKPQAIAPKAIISDINGLEEFGLSRDIKVAVLSPSNGKNWDYRLF
jgi:molybdopterin/thiamine biosynthesis adenylyltransferase